MFRKWNVALAMAVAFLPCHASAQTSNGVPVIFKSGTIGGVGTNVQIQLAGETLCRINLDNASGFIGTIQVQTQALGDTSWVAQTVFTDGGVPVPWQIGLSGAGNWTAYPIGAGTLQVINTAFTNGVISVNIACVPASSPY